MTQKANKDAAFKQTACTRTVCAGQQLSAAVYLPQLVHVAASTHRDQSSDSEFEGPRVFRQRGLGLDFFA